MRMFSPHVFTRLRQNAKTLSHKYFVSQNSSDLPRNTILKNHPKRSQKLSWVLLVIGMLLVSFNPAGYAVDIEDEIQSVEELSQNIDSESKKLGGSKLVVDHIKGSFNIDDHMVDIVRAQEVEYGEMFTIFAMAERMPGGINEDNVTRVIDIHNGRLAPRSWEDVAALVGVEMDAVTHRARALISQFLSSVDGRVS